MEAVNIKALAKELHCSTQPVYLSFASMDELREELIPIIENVPDEYIESMLELDDLAEGFVI